MLRNVRTLICSVSALPRIISKRPASIPSTRKTPRFPKTLVTLTNACAQCENKGGIDDIDAELQRASVAGRRALIDLLNNLRDQILSVSAQYQRCLDQQMTIMKEGADHMDKTWEEFRMMSADLKVELDNLLVVANTVGRMLQLEAMKYLADNKDFVQLIQKMFDELEDLLNQETEKMKELEKNVSDMRRELKK